MNCVARLAHFVFAQTELRNAFNRIAYAKTHVVRSQTFSTSDDAAIKRINTNGVHGFVRTSKVESRNFVVEIVKQQNAAIADIMVNVRRFGVKFVIANADQFGRVAQND